jgi:hypothetical protein
MKRLLRIVLFAAIYVMALSYALKYLPFEDIPEQLRMVFANGWHGTLTWMKIWHVAVVGVVGALLAFRLIRTAQDTAQIDACIIGAFAVLWGVLLRLATIGTISFGWIEVTDYLTVGLAVPLLTTALSIPRDRQRRTTSL